MLHVVPAVLPSSRTELEETLALLASFPSVHRIQIDVVDGRFASPASWPYSAPGEMQDRIDRDEMLPALDRIEYEIDLMCLDAERAADAWLALGASRLTFHTESAIDLGRLFAAVHARYGQGIVSLGLALNIETSIALVEPHLEHVGYVQFMGIARIGRQGQPFDERVLEKIRAFHAKHPHVALQVDGGVSLDTARELLAAGVSSLVVGSRIVRAADPAAEIAKFEALEPVFAR